MSRAEQARYHVLLRLTHSSPTYYPLAALLRAVATPEIVFAVCLLRRPLHSPLCWHIQPTAQPTNIQTAQPSLVCCPQHSPQTFLCFLVREHEFTHPTPTNHAASRLDIWKSLSSTCLYFSRKDSQTSLPLERKQQDHLKFLIVIN